MRDSTPLLKRFLNKVVHDLLPAALASVIGGFVFTHFHLGPFAAPPQQVHRYLHGKLLDVCRLAVIHLDALRQRHVLPFLLLRVPASRETFAEVD